MAFYSLWKWYSPWSKRNYPNRIYWYKEYVLKTEEQRKAERKEMRVACRNIFMISSIVSSFSGEYYN